MLYFIFNFALAFVIIKDVTKINLIVPNLILKLILHLFCVVQMFAKVDEPILPVPSVQGLEQIKISSLFRQGEDLLSSPSISVLSGKIASFSISRDTSTGFDGLFLSIKSTLINGKILMEGFVFSGQGEMEGDNGLTAKAKKTLIDLKLDLKQSTESKNSSFANEIKMKGMFKLKGIPYISLQFKNGASFWIKKGEVRNGIRMIHFDGGNQSPHAILEKKGHFARVNLSSQSVSEMNFLLPMEGGGSVFLKEVAEGDLFKFPILGSDGAVIEIEIKTEIIKRN